MYEGFADPALSVIDSTQPLAGEETLAGPRSQLR